MVAVPVQPGDTLSSIAYSHGASLSAVEAANAWLKNPNEIYVGETIQVPGATATVHYGSSTDGDSDSDGDQSDAPVTPVQNPASPSSVPASTPQPVTQPASSGGSGQFHIPGMPQSLTNCIAFRESTNGTNPAANGNVFGIIPASGHNVAGDSVAQQEQVAGQIYAQSGGAAWAADGCPGT